jgi:predicted short-subunit dehydrogenase-like oxidoreductase (DUF2520 family)
MSPGGHGSSPPPRPRERGESAGPPAPPRLTVGVIGTGRVGSVLGAALARAGHSVVAASGVSRESVRRATSMLPGVPLLPADEVVAAAGLVLLAVPDDVLAPLVSGLAETGAWRPGQLVAHTSGAHGVGVLEPAARAGALPLALHPAMTFAGRPEDLARLAGITFGVTAPEPLRPVAEALVLEMGATPVWVAEAARPLYHAALVVGANHLVTLVNDAADLLRRAGVQEPAAVLGPLLGAALDNALRIGDGALTGPVSRGDAGTLAEHLRTLRAQAPESVAAYVAMARLTADRALASGRLKSDQAGPLLGVLAAPARRARA